MYHITKTPMLLTTVVFAAVAALIAGGANARIPEDGGDWDSGAQASVGVGFDDSQLAGAERRAGSTRYGYVVGGELIIPQQPSGQLSSGFNGVADTGVADDRVTVGVGFP